MRPETLRVINDHGLIGFAEVAPDGMFVAVNETFAAIIDYSRFELEGVKTFQSITHAADLKADTAQAAAVAAGTIPGYTIKKRYITKLDSVVWVNLRVNGVFDSDGTFSHFAVQANPIMRFQPPAFKSTGSATPKIQPFTWLRERWQILAAGLMAVSMIIAEVIRQLTHGAPNG